MTVELENPHMKQELWMSDRYVRKLNRQYSKRERYRRKYGHSMCKLRRRHASERCPVSFRQWVRDNREAFQHSSSPKVLEILGMTS